MVKFIRQDRKDVMHKELAKLNSQWEASAQSAAIDLAREPKNKEKLESAQKWVGMNDERQRTVQECTFIAYLCGEDVNQKKADILKAELEQVVRENLQ